MVTVQAAVKKALRFWSELPAEQQQELLTKCKHGNVIQYDTRTRAWSVVNVFFGMDLCLHSPCLYLFPDEIEGKDSERAASNSTQAPLQTGS